MEKKTVFSISSRGYAQILTQLGRWEFQKNIDGCFIFSFFRDGRSFVSISFKEDILKKIRKFRSTPIPAEHEDALCGVYVIKSCFKELIKIKMIHPEEVDFSEVDVHEITLKS